MTTRLDPEHPVIQCINKAFIIHLSSQRVYAHPSHRPKRRNSSRSHFRLAFSETLEDESLLFEDEVDASLSFPFLLVIVYVGVVVVTDGELRTVLAAPTLSAVAGVWVFV